MMFKVLPSYLTNLLPEIQPLECLQLEHGETIVHAPGFEDRTMAIVDAVVPVPGTRAILLDYIPFNKWNRLSDVRDALSAKGTIIEDDDVLKYNRFDPGDFETRLKARIRAHGSHRAVVDISTMSKLGIMLVLSVCCRLDLFVRVVYSEPKRYHPSKAEFELAREKNEIHRPTLQVYNGVHGVVRVESLASVAMQGQATAALVFMSFNDALTQILLNTVYPSRLFLINSRPPVHCWREAATAWIHDQVRREWEEDNPLQAIDASGYSLPVRAVSTLDYRETVSLLIDLYWQLSANHRVVLAPIGSKLQTVGSYLVKALHPDIHIEYPSPEGFSPYYSEKAGARWLLNLGKLSKVISDIYASERREYLEIPT